jgi:hypothetical protein
MAHDHHDHSNCSHDHGHSHGPHGDAKKAAAVSDEISQRQQAADKLAKVNALKMTSFFCLLIKLIMH